MSLTVQCRPLCKTLKAVDIFCIPYLDIEVFFFLILFFSFLPARGGAVLSAPEPEFSVCGDRRAVPLGKTIRN